MTDMGPFLRAIRIRKVPLGRVVAELARRQYGAIARRQLLELGVSSDTIQRWLTDGRLHPVHAGVYAVGHRRLTCDGARMAAVLACGPGAVLSHLDAAAHWNIRRRSSGAVHVAVPGRSRHGVPGIRVHRVRRLDPRDVTVHESIPVTTLARTLLDCAASVNERALERMIEDAERNRLYDDSAIREILKRCRKCKGRPSLVAAVERATDTPPPIRSELERDFLDICREAGLPPPAVNVPLHGYEVDFLWAEQRVVVEVDSFRYHRTRAAFERDRLRDAELELTGYPVTRVTDTMIEHQPAAVAERVRRRLARAARRAA